MFPVFCPLFIPLHPYFCDVVLYPQLYFERREYWYIDGMSVKELSIDPASKRSIFQELFEDSRFVNTDPVDPDPIIMKSKVP